MEMAGIIKEHSIYGMSAGTHLACICDRRWVPHAEYNAHLVDELAEAGYGNVQEAKAKVWDEAYWTGVQDQMDASDHTSNDFGIPGNFPVSPCRVNPYQDEAV